jgi:subfamily B ATP-binding cassette protein MsbA
VTSPAALTALWPRIRPYWGPLALAMVALVVAAAVGLAFPLVVQHLLDAAFEQRDRGLLDRVALLLLVLFAIQGVANFVQVFLLSSTTERVVATLREDVFGHLLTLAPAYFAERRTGELTSRLSSDLTTLQTLLNTWISEFSRQVLFLVGGVVLLTLTHTRLTFTTLAVTPIVVGAAIVFGRSLRRATTGVQDRVADAMGMADEAISQIRVVQGFTREPLERAKFAGLLRGVVDAAVSRARVRALFFGVVGFVAFGGVVAVLYQGGLLVLDGVLTPGALVAFLLYAITVAAAVGALATLFGNYQEALGAARRIFEILAVETTVPYTLTAGVFYVFEVEASATGATFRIYDTTGTLLWTDTVTNTTPSAGADMLPRCSIIAPTNPGGVVDLGRIVSAHLGTRGGYLAASTRRSA